MFGWFRKADEKPEKQDSPKVLCEHLHWTIHGWNTIGFGSCLDCGEQISLDVAFNKLHEKMEATIAEAEKEISALRNARSNAVAHREAACGRSGGAEC